MGTAVAPGRFTYNGMSSLAFVSEGVGDTAAFAVEQDGPCFAVRTFDEAKTMNRVKQNKKLRLIHCN